MGSIPRFLCASVRANERSKPASMRFRLFVCAHVCKGTLCHRQNYKVVLSILGWVLAVVVAVTVAIMEMDCEHRSFGVKKEWMGKLNGLG